MRLFKQLAFTVLLAVINMYGAQAVADLPPGDLVIGDIALQGGSNSAVVWIAPNTKTYKVYVKIPATGTVTNAQYQVRQNGNMPDSVVCDSINIEFPCFDVIIDQTQHQNSWVQLTLNNDPDTQWDFIQNIGYVTAVSGNLGTDETLNLSARIRFEEIAPLAIGDNYQDGIIFYLDETGRHGLIAAPTDQGNLAWRKAKSLCDNLEIGTHNDWYLPSKIELNLMYDNIGPGAADPLTNIGGFSPFVYWSSTNAGGITSKGQDFSTGRNNNYGLFGKNYIRPVRAF